MSFYFTSDGSMKFTTNKVAAKGLATSSSSSSSSSSKFSTEMKNAAISSSGKLSPGAKNSLLANNADYQRFAKFQARINAIANHKPRTFDDTESATMNLSALLNYNAAIAKNVTKTKITKSN